MLGYLHDNLISVELLAFIGIDCRFLKDNAADIRVCISISTKNIPRVSDILRTSRGESGQNVFFYLEIPFWLDQQIRKFVKKRKRNI